MSDFLTSSSSKCFRCPYSNNNCNTYLACFCTLTCLWNNGKVPEPMMCSTGVESEERYLLCRKQSAGGLLLIYTPTFAKDGRALQYPVADQRASSAVVSHWLHLGPVWLMQWQNLISAMGRGSTFPNCRHCRICGGKLGHRLRQIKVN